MRIDTTKRISHQDLETPIKVFTEAFKLTFSSEERIEEVLVALRAARRPAEHFYVLDKKGRLQGSLSLPDLLYNEPTTRLRDIVDSDALKVYEDEPLERGLKLLVKHQILALPVVDRDNHFKGVLEIIPHDSDWVFKSKKAHYKSLKEDLFQFIGFSIEQRKWNAPWTEYRHRMPWLLCNLVGGLICAVISEVFKMTLIEYVILAFFIPLVLTLSESVSIQSMTLSLRFLHLRKILWGQVARRLVTEARSSLLLGLTCALMITAFYFAWSVDVLPVIGIGVSIVGAMSSSALFGAFFPILLHLLRLDPKVAAGPVVLMIADIFTITIYLSLNTFILMT